MIARAVPAPRAEPSPRPGWRSARVATEVRRNRARRLRYRLIARTVSALGVATLAVLAYLGLLANITRLNYEVGHAKQARALLALATMRNDGEIARLLSRDKLEALAARLGMRDAGGFEVVLVPPRPRHHAAAPKGIAFLSGVAGWLR